MKKFILFSISVFTLFILIITSLFLFTYLFPHASIGTFNTDIISVKKAEAASGDYIIGPQDRLKIEIWDHPDLTKEVDVSLSGTFTFPLIGEIMANGLTVYQVQTLIRKQLADGYIVNPNVQVSVTEYRSKQINILGEVEKPGIYPFTRQTSLIEIISTAGGLTENAGEEVYILRTSDKEIKLNQKPDTNSLDSSRISKHKINLNNMLDNKEDIYFLLKQNDTIYVPKADFFYVLGEVQSPGEFKYNNDITVLKAITMAGGHTKKANLEKIKIVRTIIENNIEKEKEISLNLNDRIKPNDIIKVPESFF